MDIRPNSSQNVGQSIWRSLFEWHTRGPVTRPERVLQLTELESRVLFSAAPAAAITLDPSLVQSAELLPTADITTLDTTGSSAETSSAALPDLQESEATANETASNARIELVFVDRQIDDLATVLADLQRDVPGRELVIIELQANENGVDRIAMELANRRDISAIHIVSHGDESTVQLGNTWLSLANIDSQAPAITAWGTALTSDADILFYGCNLAGSESGRNLLEAVSILTAADTAASIDATGSAILGGDWDLEFHIGTIDTGALFSAHVEQNWQHLLETTVVQNGLNSYSGTMDTILDSAHPGSINGGTATTSMQIGGAAGTQGLLRFDSLFGPSPSQVPVGNTIEEVSLSLDVMTPISIGSVIQLHRITTPWDANSTWDSLSGGLQIGIDTSALADATFTVTSDDAGQISLTSSNLISTVQDWSNGDANYGWLITTNSTQILELRAAEDSSSAFRPQLSIQHSQITPFLPTGELRVNPLTTGTQTTGLRDRGSHDAVAVAANGNYVVVYSSPTTFTGYSEDATSMGVFAQRYNSLGMAVGAAIQVNQFTTSDQQWASVAMSATGDFVVTWTSTGQDQGVTTGVYTRGFFADGTQMFSEQLVNTTTAGNQMNSAIGMDDTGRFVIAWSGNSAGDADGIFYRRFSANGSALDATEVLANSTTTGDQQDVAIAFSNGGNFVIAWDDETGIHARRFEYASGTALDVVQMTAQSGNTAGNADVAIDASGHYVLTWQATSGGDGSGTGIWARRYNADTNSFEAPVAVTQTVANNQASPSIAMDANGNYLIAWEGSGPGDTSGVFIRTFAADGVPVSDESRMNTTASGSQAKVSLGLRNLHNFVAVWSGQGPNDTSGVFMRQFGVAPLPSPALMLSTVGDVSGSLAPGLSNWQAGDLLQFGDPNYTLGTSISDGTFHWFGTVNDAFTTDVNVDALHFVSQDMTIGGTNHAPLQLRSGDILFSIASDATLTTGGTVTAFDIMYFRPVAEGNYTFGTTNYVFSGLSLLADSDLSGLNNINAWTLIEQDTVVGGALLQAGDFLFTRNGAGNENDVYWFHTADAGPGNTGGTVDKLIEGNDLAITAKVSGLELLEATTEVGGELLSAGTLMLTVDDHLVGIAGSLSVKPGDLFSVSLVESTLVHGTASGTASLLLDSDDIHMTGSNELLDAVALISRNSPPVANNDLYLVPEQGPFTPQQTWFNGGWQARQKLTFNNATRAEHLNDFPILVTLDSTRIDYSRTQSDGADIRFVDGNGTELAYEIESWDSAGRSYIWVKVPRIDASSATDFIWMYYDNPAATAGQNAADVWTNGYVGVWHFSDDLDASNIVRDSTANSKDGVGSNLTTSDQIVGISGSGLDLDGNSEYIRIASSISDVLAITGSQITVEAWAQRNFDPANWQVIVGRQYGDTSADSYALIQSGLDPDTTQFVAERTASQDNALPLNEWHYLTGTRLGTNVSLYNNGVRTGLAPGSNIPLLTDNNDVTIGAQENGATSTVDEFFHGLLDEVRISNVARSAAWTSAQYASMTDSLITYETVQTFAGLLENDRDLNGDTLSIVSIDTTGLSGIITVNQNGTFLYHPDSSFDSLASGQTATTGFTYTTEDGHGGIDTATVTLQIQGQNDAPVLNLAAPLTFSVVQDDPDPAGYTLSTMLTGAITDIDTGALQGIAVTGAMSTNGQWQFSLNGSTWTSLSDAAPEAATLLDLSAQVRFVPNPGYSGQSGALTFRAWDQTVGSNGAQHVPVGATGGTSAFSAATGGITVNVIGTINSPVGVNDTYLLTEDSPFTSHTNWHDAAWSYRQAISFNNILRAENLIDFPVLVELNAASFNYNLVQSQGQDLRFIDANGTALNYEIESWSPTGASFVWVRVPQIDAASNSDFIWMYYGNSAATAGQNPQGVWSDNYDAVYHFNSDAGTSGAIVDSTNQVHGTNNGSSFTSGAIGGGQSFDGVSNHIDLGRNIQLLNGAGASTISAWINADDSSEIAGLVSIAQAQLLNQPTNASRAALELHDEDLFVSARTGLLNLEQTASTTSTPIADDDWVYVTSVIDYVNDRIDVYVDGVLVVSETVAFVGSVEAANAENGALGSNDTGTGAFFEGELDEVRIQSTARSSAWLSAEYASMTGTLISMGTQEQVTSVLSNDSDPNSDPLTATLQIGPSHAAAFQFNSNGTFSYTPDTDYFGLDSFTYRAFDGANASNLTTVTLQIQNVNDRPVITTNAIAVTEGVPLTLNSTMLLASDIDNNAEQLTYTVTSLQNAEVRRSGSNVTTFTQADVNNGLVEFLHDGSNTAPSFSYHVSDGALTTTTEVANVTFTSVNDAPSISSIDAQIIDEDTATGALAFSIGDEETSAAAITVTASSSNTALVPNNAAYLILAGSGANRSLNVIPLANQSGSSVITLTVSDGTTTSQTTFLLTVNGINDPPVMVTNAVLALDEGATQLIDSSYLSTADIDTSPADIVYSSTTSPSGGFLALTTDPTNSVTSFRQSDIDSNRLIYVHQGGESNSDSFTFEVSDGDTVLSASFVINVTPVNDAPVITNLALTLTEGDSVVLTDVDFGSSDTDHGSSYRVWNVVSITGGVFERVTAIGTPITSFSQAEIIDGHIRFVHDGTETSPVITMTVTDGLETTLPAMANVTFTSVNDAPSVSSIDAQIIDEDTATGALAFSIGDEETSAAALTVTASSSNTALVPSNAANLILAGSGANRTLNVIPLANQSGSSVITLTVSDGTTTSQTTFLLTVNGVNDPPVIVNQSFTTAEHSAINHLIGTVMATDADTAETLTFQIISGNDSGAFLLDANGQLKVADSALLDFETQVNWPLVVEVRDSAGLTATATVTVTLTNVNEAPQLAAGSWSIDENAADNTALGSVSASDPDTGAALEYRIVSGNIGEAFRIHAATGAISVANGAALDAETQASFLLNVEVSDQFGLTATATMTIVVNDLNEPVTSVALPPITVNEDALPIVRDITSAFTNPDYNDAISYRILGTIPGLFSSVTIQPATGLMTVVLTPNAFGSESITIEATDSAGHTATTVQSVVVLSVNDAPNGHSDTYELSSGQTLVVPAAQGLLANDSDVDNPSLTILVTSTPASGTLLWQPDGSFTFSSVAGSVGNVGFTYVVQDGETQSGPVSVTLSFLSATPNGAALALTTGNSGGTDSGSGTSTTDTSSSGGTTGDETSASTSHGTTESTTGMPSDTVNTSSSGAVTAVSGAPGGLLTPLSTGDESTWVAMNIQPGTAVDIVLGARRVLNELDQLVQDRRDPADTAARVLSALGNEIRTGSMGSFTWGKTELSIVSAQRLQTILQSNQVWDQLDASERGIQSSGVLTNLITNTTTVTFSTSVTIGYVLWTLRGGVLLTTFVAQMPAWRLVDPLIVLESMGPVNNDDDESLESIVQKGSEMEDTAHSVESVS